MTLDDFFSGQETSRLLFDALLAAGSAVAPAETRASKSQVAFRRRRAFAWAWIPGRYLSGPRPPLVVSFALARRDPSPRWKQVVEPARAGTCTTWSCARAPTSTRKWWTGFARRRSLRASGCGRGRPFSRTPSHRRPMKKELRAALEAELTRQVPAVLGAAYQRVALPKGERYLVCQGEIAFVERSSPSMARFLSIIPDQKRSAFTVELGWSRDGDFPATSARPSARPVEAARGQLSHGFVRLAELYTGTGEDWDASPLEVSDPTSIERLMAFEMRRFEPGEAVALMRPLVEDALRKVQKHAPAFFDSMSAGAGR